MMMYFLTTFERTIIVSITNKQKIFVDTNPCSPESAAKMSTPKDTIYFVVRSFSGKSFNRMV